MAGSAASRSRPSVGHPRVMAGGQRGRPEPVGQREHLVEPDVAVAGHARVGGLPRRVAGQERVHDARPELRPQVQREVREAHAVRDHPREPDRVGAAAGRGGVVLLVAPELERHRDGVLAQQMRGHGGVHAAAHRHQHAPVVHRHVGATGRGAERAMERVGGQIGGVQLSGRQPAQFLRDRGRAHARGVEEVLALDQVHGRGAGGGQRAATVGVEARLHDAIAGDHHRHADQVAAQRAPGVAVKAPGTQSAAPVGRGEMLFKAFAVHDRLSLRPAVLDAADDAELRRSDGRACATPSA